MGKELSLNILEIAKKVQKLEEAGGGGGSADSAKRSDIATEFNTTTAYTAGCYVYHEGTLYQFNTDHAAGAWDPTDVVAANVTDQIVSNASAIAGLSANDISYSSGTVKDALDGLTNDTLSSSFVDLMQYNSDQNYFTIPSDGFVKCSYNSSGSDPGQLRAILSDDTNISIFAAMPDSQTLSMYVKKGMKIYLYNVTSFYSCSFIPLI